MPPLQVEAAFYEAVQRFLADAPVRLTTLDELENRQSEIVGLVYAVKVQHEWLKCHGADQAAPYMKQINAARSEARRAHTAFRAARRRNVNDKTFWRAAGRKFVADARLRGLIENLNGLRTGMLESPKRLIPRNQVGAKAT